MKHLGVQSKQFRLQLVEVEENFKIDMHGRFKCILHLL